MDVLDLSNRWVYKGSSSAPPCTTKVFYNVLSTIYPIKNEHLQLFKDRLESETMGLGEDGNWRVIQNIDKHDVFFVQNNEYSITKTDAEIEAEFNSIIEDQNESI